MGTACLFDIGVSYNSCVNVPYLEEHKRDRGCVVSSPPLVRYIQHVHLSSSGRHVGEMYTSAAPYDPIFWVVHPTIDRLLAWRRILAIDYPDT